MKKQKQRGSRFPVQISDNDTAHKAPSELGAPHLCEKHTKVFFVVGNLVLETVLLLESYVLHRRTTQNQWGNRIKKNKIQRHAGKSRFYVFCYRTVAFYRVICFTMRKQAKDNQALKF